MADVKLETASATRAMAAGAWRAVASPFVLVWLWLLNVAVAAPGAWLVARSIEEGIGASRVHEHLRSGFDMEWYAEFSRDAEGLSSTLSPTHTGAGAFYDNLEGLSSGRIFDAPVSVIMLGAVFALVWLAMLGGVVDRYADRASRASARRFFGAGRRFFFRFLRLAILSGVLYAAVYVLFHRMSKWMEIGTIDVTVEGTILYYSLLIWGLTAVLLVLIHASFGFAKVATVVDDRRSMVLAAVRGVTFVTRHPLKVLGLYSGFLLVAGLALAVYATVAPGVGQQTGQAVARAFAAGQLFLLLKLYLRLWLLGGQTVLYQALARPAAEAPTLPADPLP